MLAPPLSLRPNPVLRAELLAGRRLWRRAYCSSSATFSFVVPDMSYLHMSCLICRTWCRDWLDHRSGRCRTCNVGLNAWALDVMHAVMPHGRRGMATPNDC